MTTTLNRNQIGRLRLAAQGLLAPTAASPVDVVDRLAALQGQDLPGALYSVGLRMKSGSRSAVLAALDAGDIVRSWPMRGTLHLLRPATLSLILPLTAERMVRSATARHRALDISDSDIEQSRDAALAALEAHPRRTRAQMFEAFEAAGQRTTGQRGIHLLWLLCLKGWLVQGPLDGKDQLYVGYERWIGPIPERDPQDALATLLLAYLRGHGPASERDAAWWTGLPLTAVRAAIDAISPQLADATFDGATYWMAPETAGLLAGPVPGQRSLLALPGFDEFLLGYGDRSAALAPEHAERTVPGNNGMFRSTIVYGGQVIGTWRKANQPGNAVVPEPFGELTARQRAAFDRAVAAHRRFLET